MADSFERVTEVLGDLFGLPCCRRRVGPTRRALSIGFGEERIHGNPRLVDRFYGEWEVGTYYSGWRIVEGGRILCGSDDVVDSTEELQHRVMRLDIGSPRGLAMLSEFDVRFQFENEVCIDFLATIGEDDEQVVHIFGPKDLYVEFRPGDGWEVGRASEPAR